MALRLPQSNEVSSSYHMGKEGLHRALEYVEQNSLEVGVLVTDRHQQINKWIRESHPQIKHYFYVWHVAKCEYCYTQRQKLRKFLSFRISQES